MPFALTNVPVTFEAYINQTLSEYLDHFCSTFLDDTIIYSKTLEEHIIHIRQVLQRLSNSGLHLNPKKCEFHQTETTYLGLIIGHSGVRMQPEKDQAIQDWKTPANHTDMCSFLGHANFNQRFIHSISSTV